VRAHRGRLRDWVEVETLYLFLVYLVLCIYLRIVVSY